MISMSLRPHIQVTRDDQSTLILDLGKRRIALAGIDSDLEEALLLLADAPLVWDSQAKSWSYGRPGIKRAPEESVIAQLVDRRVIQVTCSFGERDLMVAYPSGGPASFEFGIEAGDMRLRLSRFAYARNSGGVLMMELPHRFLRARLLEAEVASLLVGLAYGESVSGLCQNGQGPDKELNGEVVRFLLGIGAIGVVSDKGYLDEDVDADLAPREFHDVAFHGFSRLGLTDGALGAQYPFLGTLEPAPAVKQFVPASSVCLPKPDLAAMVRDDPPLARVMEERRSQRKYGARRITLEELAEFLYRTARVRSLIPAAPDAGLFYDTSSRPYPNGGAAYDLELYITIGNCAGIPSGIYHYEPVEHALSLVNDDAVLTRAMLDRARWATAQESPPILITYASRFKRLNWKYRAISYATTLKNVGVLYQAMYLAGTAMGLAPCALGSGDSAIFSRVTGLSPLVESSVGEFSLGPCRQPGEQAAEVTGSKRKAN
jgi:oxazoline/thiazoline dehydrogenase